MKAFRLFAAVALTLCLCPPVLAQENSLTKQAIEAFYKESETVQKKPMEEYMAFVDAHTNADARIDMKVTVTVKGQEAEPASTALSFDKKKFLESSQEGWATSRRSDVSTTLSSIEIAPDRKTATVKGQSIMENPDVAIPGVPGAFSLYATGQCEDVVTYQQGAGVQTLKSSCTMDMTYTPLQP